MKTVALLSVAFCLATGPVAAGTEIFHWVDEDGVHHYTQEAPDAETRGVETLTLQDATPQRYDPEADPFNVAAQEDRMVALREQMAERRKERAEARRQAAQQRPVQYQQPYRTGWTGGFWHPPYYPRPPVRPEPPIAVPYETRILVPPGSNPD